MVTENFGSLKIATEIETEIDEVGVKPSFRFSVLTLKLVIAHHKTANFDAEVENN